MSVFDSLKVVVRCAIHSAEITPLGGEPDATCDIIDENGEPVFSVDEQRAPLERVSVQFGSRDVAVLLARDHGAGLIVIRVQVADAMTPDAEAAEGVL